MEFLKKYEDFSEHAKSTNESVMKVDDIYKVKTTLDVPQSLINALVKKVKEENSKNAREFWSDIDIAEEIAKYVISTFMSIDNVPASILVGETGPVETPIEEAPVEETPAAPVAEAPVATPTEEAPAAAEPEAPVLPDAEV